MTLTFDWFLPRYVDTYLTWGEPPAQVVWGPARAERELEVAGYGRS